MAVTPPNRLDNSLGGALAKLESRWGMAAVRVGSGARSAPADAGPYVHGSLALATLPDPVPITVPGPADDVLPTGFSRLDAVLGVGGLPRGASATLRGAGSSGKTAIALHCLAQAQAHGAIVAFLDFCRTFDPLEAASRGVDLRWLLIVRPADAEEGLALGAALLAGRQIDLLVVDLPRRFAARHEAALRRLAAHARRQRITLIVLEPEGVGRPIHGALAETVSVRLELEQRAWLRAGRDVVGRCVTVSVAKNRFGPPGRQADVEIRYLAEGDNFPAIERFALPDA